MDSKLKQSLIMIAFGVGCFAALTNVGAIFALAQKIFTIFLPIILGFILAFVINVPMRGFERLFTHIFRKRKRKPNDKVISVISLVLTLVCILSVIVLVFTIMIPELIASIKSICVLIEKSWPEWATKLSQHNINTEKLSELLADIDLNKVIDTLSGGADMFLGSVLDISASIVSGMFTFLFALVVALYVLTSKQALVKHSTRILFAYIKEPYANKICHASALLQDAYSKFFSGQCIEAVILGVLILISFSIFGLPYAPLIAVLTSICAFVPYIGAFASCFVGAFLILLSEPSKVLLCIIVYFVVQFIETQFIYPRVVGKSVGLSPLLTLLAAMVGGKIFGLLGIIFFIPLVAVICELIQESTDKRLSKKRIKKVD